MTRTIIVAMPLRALNDKKRRSTAAAPVTLGDQANKPYVLVHGPTLK